MSDAADATLETGEDGPAEATLSVDNYGRALKLSFGGHVLLVLIVVVKSLVFPSKPTPYVPTLRVDMVALPDHLKNELQNVPLSKGSKEIAEAIKQAEQEAKKIKAIKLPDAPAEKADPDEMVLKPKQAPKQPKDEELSSSKHNAKKMKSALDRIKSLAKIESETEAPAAKPVIGTTIKGNKISKGTTLSGDAKEAAQASYYDELRSRLQENWELPVWIARQNLDAQIRVFIDSRGKVRSFQFVKSSGNPQFDSAIKKTLEESQPFPKPPDEIASSLLVDGVMVGFPL